MSHWKVIVKLARRCLIVMAVAIAVALALYASSRYLRNQAASSLAQAQQVEIENQSALATKQSDLAKLEAEIAHFSQLRQQGLVGVPDRTGWVEQLKASQQRINIQGKMVYTLQPPKPLSAQSTAAAGAEVPAVDGDSGQSSEPQFHDLELEVANVHEGDLLALLDDYRAHVKGRFRVEACNLSGRTENGMLARCTLRFFTLAQAAAAPAQQ